MGKSDRSNQVRPVSEPKLVSEPKKELGIKVRVVAEAKISAGCTRFQEPSCGIGYRTT